MEPRTPSRAVKGDPILIIDDDTTAISTLTRILRKGGYSRVLSTAEPQNAPALVSYHRPSLVLLDLNMPEMDGFEVMQEILNLGPSHPIPAVLVLTAADERSARLRALRFGAAEFLVKPYDRDELLLRVGNLLATQSQRRLSSSFLDSTPAAMIAVDASGDCVYVNRSALDLLGYAESDAMIGQKVHDLIHHMDEDGAHLEASACPVSSVCTHGEPVHQTHATFWRSDGTPLPVEYWAYPLRDAREFDTVLITFVDLRERLAAERELRLANTVFDSVNRALIITDADANIISVNPAYTQLTGWSKEDVLGKNPRFRQSGRHDEDFYAAMWDALRREGQWEGEIWNLRKDGAAYLEEARITTVRDRQGRISHYVATLRDLTQERLRSQALERARQEAEAANAAKSRFVANMSHEIRTPLTAILTSAEMLAEPDTTLIDQDQTLDIILRNTHYLQDLVNDILDFSKIEANRLEVEQIPIQLAELLQDINVLADTLARKKGIGLQVLVEPPWPRVFLSDPTRIKQILMNLLSNAIKFTQQGQVTLRVAFAPPDEQLVCMVEDSGIGIAEDRLDEIFDAFAQADASTTRSHGGSGLGLTISRLLARKLGGDLSVRSTPGVGSVFTATFATARVPEASLEYSAPNLTAHASHAGAEQRPDLHGTVLLAEDYADNRALISAYIAGSGAQVTLAENGLEALELAQQQEFDLVLMDMQMPVMDGLEATRLLRLTGFDGPVVALTANASEADREAAREAGCDGFLAKPIQNGPFYATLARYLKPGRPLETDEPGTSISHIPDFEGFRERFLESLPGHLADMRQAVDDRDHGALATLAHQLKGVAGSFGLPEATRAAGILEGAARGDDEAAVARLLNELEDICQNSLG